MHTVFWNATHTMKTLIKKARVAILTYEKVVVKTNNIIRNKEIYFTKIKMSKYKKNVTILYIYANKNRA